MESKCAGDALENRPPRLASRSWDEHNVTYTQKWRMMTRRSAVEKVFELISTPEEAKRKVIVSLCVPRETRLSLRRGNADSRGNLRCVPTPRSPLLARSFREDMLAQWELVPNTPKTSPRLKPLAKASDMSWVLRSSSFTVQLLPPIIDLQTTGLFSFPLPHFCLAYFGALGN